MSKDETVEATPLADVAIEVLQGRKHFDGWFGRIDNDIQTEIRTELNAALVRADSQAVREWQPTAALWDEVVEALRGVSIMINSALHTYEQEPWANRVRAVLSKIDAEKNSGDERR
jgi:hypothetical protein